MNGLEFFSLIRQAQSPDVFAEYTNFEQLRRMRQAYIVHVLDHVLAERSTIAWNDRAAEEEELAEEHGTKVTLENVFELAKQKESDK